MSESDRLLGRAGPENLNRRGARSASTDMTKLERLDDSLRQDPQPAKVEILKHLDGDLVIEPRASTASEQRARDQAAAQKTTAPECSEIQA
jgi:hypothetical protein